LARARVVERDDVVASHERICVNGTGAASPTGSRAGRRGVCATTAVQAWTTIHQTLWRAPWLGAVWTDIAGKQPGSSDARLRARVRQHGYAPRLLPIAGRAARFARRLGDEPRKPHAPAISRRCRPSKEDSPQALVHEAGRGVDFRSPPDLLGTRLHFGFLETWLDGQTHRFSGPFESLVVVQGR